MVRRLPLLPDAFDRPTLRAEHGYPALITVDSGPSVLYDALEDSVYVNNLGDKGQGRVQAAYGENYQRLAALKRNTILPICFA